MCLPELDHKWPRFTIPTGTLPFLDGDFLFDPMSEQGRSVNAAAAEFNSLADRPCIVLLGDSGFGKSDVFRKAYNAIRLRFVLRACSAWSLRSISKITNSISTGNSMSGCDSRDGSKPRSRPISVLQCIRLPSVIVRGATVELGRAGTFVSGKRPTCFAAPAAEQCAAVKCFGIWHFGIMARDCALGWRRAVLDLLWFPRQRHVVENGLDPN